MTRGIAFLLASLVSSAAWAQKDTKDTKDMVAVLDLTGTGIEASLLPTLTEILTVEIDALGQYKVIAGRDIQAMLGFEKQKDMLGCTEAACLAEIGGALGVDRIVSGNVGKVGTTYVVNIKLINIREATTEGRVYETVRGADDALIATIRRSVGKLFGIEMAEPEPTREVAAPAPAAAPPPPVTVKQRRDTGIGAFPYVLWTVGGLGVGAGVFAGLKAKDLEKKANDPKYLGGQLAARDAPRLAKIATIALGAGGGLIGLGIIVAWARSGDDDEEDATARLTPVVGPQQVGFAFSGTF